MSDIIVISSEGDVFEITTRPCKVCERPVEYVNGETDGCHSCLEAELNTF
tara:strand:- start:1029 stop:1178 length:150 start_codon:yes stop_codon:yes gene_type:complete